MEDRIVTVQPPQPPLRGGGRRENPVATRGRAPMSKSAGAASHSSRQDAESCANCAYRNRCHGCLEELVHRFQTPLLHFLLRRVGSRQDAEDLVQETFL